MASTSSSPKYKNIVLKMGFSPIPQDPAKLAQLLFDTFTGGPDGDAKLGLLIDQIAASGEDGRRLLEQTRSTEAIYFTVTMTNANTLSAQRIREKIASRLCR